MSPLLVITMRRRCRHAATHLGLPAYVNDRHNRHNLHNRHAQAREAGGWVAFPDCAGLSLGLVEIILTRRPSLDLADRSIATPKRARSGFTRLSASASPLGVRTQA